MTTWSDWIKLDGCEYPKGAHVRFSENSRFRVRINDDGWSDWIGWNGGECPVTGQMVCYLMRDGQEERQIFSDVLGWFQQGATSDIIAFKVQAAKPEPAKQGSYYVSVFGMSAPTKAHDTLDSAIAEAQRLGKQPANAQRDVMVFQLFATLPPAERRVVMVGEEA